jgi:ribosomal protein S14
MGLLIVGLWLLCGVIAAGVYTSKGRSGAEAFIVGVALGPIGVLLALLTPSDTAALEHQAVTSGAMRKCPHCAELIRPEATVCRHCTRELAPAVVLGDTQARKIPYRAAAKCSACNGDVRLDAVRCKHCKREFV